MVMRHLAILGLLLFVAPAARAQWLPIDGVSLSGGFSQGYFAYYPDIVSDGADGAITVWRQTQGDHNIGAGRVDPNGLTQWRVGVCTASGIQTYPRAVSDGAGGAIVVWLDERVAAPGPGIYAQRVDGDGNPQWMADGIPVCVAPAVPIVMTFTLDAMRVTSDGAGGMYVIWRDERHMAWEPDIYVQRVFANGTTWAAAAAGISVLATPPHDQLSGDLASDGSNGVIITWETSDQDIWAQRLDPSGSRLWGANGAPVCTFGGGQYYPRIAAASDGGAIVTWADIRSTLNEVYVQKLDASANPMWASDGVSAGGSGRVAADGSLRIIGDDAGGAHVAWLDEAANPGVVREVFACHVDSSAASTTPASVSTTNGYHSDLEIARDGAGGMLLVWTHEAQSNADIRAQWINAAGVHKATAGGAVICSDASSQLRPRLAQSGGAGRGIAAWDDARYTPWEEVFGQMVGGNSVAGDNVTVSPVDPNTGTAPITLTFDHVDEPGVTTLTTSSSGPQPPGTFQVAGLYYDLNTNAVFSGLIEVCIHYNQALLQGPESDVKILHYDGTSWVDVTTSLDTVANVVCGLVSSLSPFVVGTGTVPTGVGGTPANRFALHQNIPNPFNPTTMIAFEVPAGGADVNLSVFDASGRRVRELVNGRRVAGRWSVQWNGEDDRGTRVASGVYFYRMRAGEFVDTRKMVLLK